MIEISGINKSYRTLSGAWSQVLNNVQLTIPNDMNLGILGRNGAGKSTLLRILSGLEAPDSGRVITNGRRMSWPLGTPAGVHGSLTGRENIRFIARVFNRDFDEMYAFIAEFAELAHYMDMPVKTYSSGMKSRLTFGISMAIEFDTYLIDEGFAAGDATFRAKTQAMFADRSATANVIVVSHNPRTIKRMCNTVAVLHNGAIQLYTDVDEGIGVYQTL